MVRAVNQQQPEEAKRVTRFTKRQERLKKLLSFSKSLRKAEQIKNLKKDQVKTLKRHQETVQKPRSNSSSNISL